MLHFCTLFDSNYRSRGITMFESLRQHNSTARLYVLCLDDRLFNSFQEEAPDGLVPIRLADLEAHFPQLPVAKANRSFVEYIFTLSPFLPLYVLDTWPDIPFVTSMDADILFYSDPAALFENFDRYSIAITPHRFKRSLAFLGKYGLYNVSFQTFRRDATGLACLHQWKDQCAEWCYDAYEPGRFADQKYLDTWLDDFKQVHVFPTGAGSAPWNIRERDLSKDPNGNLLIEGHPLVYYHFHGVRNIDTITYSVGLNEYFVLRRRRIVQWLYAPYMNRLTAFSAANAAPSGSIVRGTHPYLGRLPFIVFLADLYRVSTDRVRKVYNLNIFRYLYTAGKIMAGHLKMRLGLN